MDSTNSMKGDGFPLRGDNELPQASGSPSPTHRREPSSPPANGVPFPNTRPKRVTRPSSRLDPAVWDLSGLNQSPAPITMEMCLEMIRWIADNSVSFGKEDSPGGGR